MRTLSTAPTSTGAEAEYARATWRTAQAMADPSASLMDRYLAAEAEEAACRAAREAEPELEAGF